MTNLVVNDLLRRLRETGVPITMAEDEVVPFTPRNKVTVNFCGTTYTAPDHFVDDPPIVSTKSVQFQQNIDNKEKIKNKIPEIVLTENDELVFYKKNKKKYKKGQLDQLLREQSKRNSRDMVIYVYKLSPVVDRVNEETNDEEPRNPAVDPIEQIHLRRGSEDDSSSPVVDRVNAELRSGREERNPPDVEGDTFSQDSSDVEPVSRGAASVTVDTQMLSPESDEFLFTSDQSRSPFRFYHNSNQDILNTSGHSLDNYRYNEEFPDLVVESWKEVKDLPPGEEINLGDVMETDITKLSKSVKEVKTENDVSSETRGLDLNSTNFLPDKLSSDWSVEQLMKKGVFVKNEFEVFRTKRDMSTEMFSLSCLVLAKDAMEETHVVTPDEVDCVKQNIDISKPAETATNIIIVTPDVKLTSVSLLTKSQNGEFNLNSILTDDNEKEYMSKLLVKDVCDKMKIRVNIGNYVLNQLQKIENHPISHVEVPDICSLFLNTVCLMGFNTNFTIDELDRLVGNIRERIREFETLSVPESDSDSEMDWYSDLNSLKEELKQYK